MRACRRDVSVWCRVYEMACVFIYGSECVCVKGFLCVCEGVSVCVCVDVQCRIREHMMQKCGCVGIYVCVVVHNSECVICVFVVVGTYWLLGS